MYYPFTPLMLAEIGPAMGVEVELEPVHRFAGELRFSNGRRHLFHNANLNINPAAAVQIANDKFYTCHFLRKAGFSVPQGQTFFADPVNQKMAPSLRRGLDDALMYAAQLAYPVFIKPNNLSQGEHVSKVWQPAQLRLAGEAIFARNNVLLVEQACTGRDYRVVVLDDAVFAAFERVPLGVSGDGVHTILELLVQQQQQLRAQNRMNSNIDVLDVRMDAKLAQVGLTRASVLPAGERRVLLDNANLSTGGQLCDISEQIHADFVDIAVRASKTIGLRMSGLDFIADDLTAPAAGQSWHIIEINAAPAQENYAAAGEKQRERVRILYRQVLQILAQMPV
jgi:D-alanine-D-alanine ligase-like ATP-grasp enzyme